MVVDITNASNISETGSAKGVDDDEDRREALEEARGEVHYLESAPPGARSRISDFDRVLAEAIATRDRLQEEAKARKPTEWQYMAASKKVQRLTKELAALDGEREQLVAGIAEIDERAVKKRNKLMEANGELAAARARAAQDAGFQPRPQAVEALLGVFPQLHSVPAAWAAGNGDVAILAIYDQVRAALLAMGIDPARLPVAATTSGPAPQAPGAAFAKAFGQPAQPQHLPTAAPAAAAAATAAAAAAAFAGPLPGQGWAAPETPIYHDIATPRFPRDLSGDSQRQGRKQSGGRAADRLSRRPRARRPGRSSSPSETRSAPGSDWVAVLRRSRSREKEQAPAPDPRGRDKLREAFAMGARVPVPTATSPASSAAPDAAPATARPE